MELGNDGEERPRNKISYNFTYHKVGGEIEVTKDKFVQDHGDSIVVDEILSKFINDF